MRERKRVDCKERKLVDTPELQAMLSCGYQAAMCIGTEAGARVQVGRRVLWNVGKIQRYIDSVSE